MLTNNSPNFTTGPQNANGNSMAIMIAMTLVYVVAILGGTFGNSFVILVVLFNRSMHSSTNYFISSLAAADVIVTSVCMPLFFVYNVLTWPVWPFGRFGCRILSYLVHVSVMASALSLLAISYDRCLSIFFPLKRLVTLSRAKKAIGVIWFASPLLLLPSLLHHDTVSSASGENTSLKCVESWDTDQQLHAYQMYRISFYFLFVFLIAVVYCMIGVSLYRRQQPGEQTAQDRAKALLAKRKIIRMLFLVVAMFTLSWLPYMINKLLNIFPPHLGYKSPNSFVLVGNFLGLLNSVANPIIYAVLNKTYRTGFKYAIRCKFNFEREERRRTMSLSMRNGSSLSKTQSRRRRNTDSRKSSLSTENVVMPGDDSGDTAQPIVCLSFVANVEIPLQELSNTASSNNSGLSGKRRVSFGGECLAGAESENQDANHAEERARIDCVIHEEDVFADAGSSTTPSTLPRAENEDTGAMVNESYTDEEFEEYNSVTPQELPSGSEP